MKVLYKNFISMLRRFPVSILMNIAGLVLAFSVFAIIMMEVQYEMTYDSRIRTADRIFHLSWELPGGTVSCLFARPQVEQWLATKSPEIEKYALRENWYLQAVTEDGDTEIGWAAHGVTPHYFEMFDFEWITCDTATFDRSNYLFIPECMALQYFGRTDLVGTAIYRKGNNEQWIIGGVYRDFPDNCSVENHIYSNLAYYQYNNWTESRYFSYFQLRDPSKKDEVEALLNEDKELERGDVKIRLTPYKELFYHPELQTTYDQMPKANPHQRYIYLCICVLIIFVAAINFTNFYTATTPLRMRSLNTQRVLGARRSRLVRTLITEGMGLSVLSFALSLLVVQALGKSFVNDLFNADIRCANYPLVLALTGGISLLVGWLASVFPAHYAMSFQPALVIKGNFGLTARGRWMRNFLLGVQLSVAMAMVIIMGGVICQNYYMRHTALGYDQDRLLTVNLQSVGVGEQEAEAFCSGLRQVACVQDVALSCVALSANFVHQVMSWGRMDENGEKLNFVCMPVSSNYLKTMGIRLLEGEDFNPNDRRSLLIFNKAAYDTYSSVRVGKTLADGCSIVGICENFKFSTLREEVPPLALVVFGDGEYAQWGYRWVANIRVREGVDLLEALAPIRDYCKKYAPDKEWDIKTQFQNMENIYKEEKRMQQTLVLFCVMAVVIALSGVFSMTLFECNYRRKEIGLRKIMGATSGQIIRMFCRQYGRVIFLGFVVAAPTGWYAVHYYLQAFAYKTPVHWWLFLLSLCLMGGVTLLVVVLQCRQVARENPINSIRTE